MAIFLRRLEGVDMPEDIVDVLGTNDSAAGQPMTLIFLETTGDNGFEYSKTDVVSDTQWILLPWGKILMFLLVNLTQFY